MLQLYTYVADVGCVHFRTCVHIGDLHSRHMKAPPVIPYGVASANPWQQLCIPTRNAAFLSSDYTVCYLRGKYWDRDAGPGRTSDISSVASLSVVTGFGD